MRKVIHKISVQLPNQDDFQKRFPQYGPFARSKGSFIFSIVMTPKAFIKAKAATDLELPALSGIAKMCFEAIESQNSVPFDGFVKQYIGALVCTLMEANGYQKTGTKKSVKHPKFNKGEFYRSRYLDTHQK